MIKRKTAVIITALVLLLGCFVGGTVAYLISETDMITNTFTVGNVKISLIEHDSNSLEVTSQDYPGVPGQSFKKDPTVKVESYSEDCYLFVKVVENNNTVLSDTKIIIYDLNLEGWTQLKIDEIDVPGVYYRKVNKSDTNKSWNLIQDDTVTFNSSLTAEQVPSLDKKPSISFKAAAVQMNGIGHGNGEGTVEQAWELVKDKLN